MHVLVDPSMNGGQDYAAGQITRVWEDGTINVHVLPDSRQTLVFRGIPLLAERPKPAQRSGHPAFLAENPTFAWWPPLT